MGLLDYFPKSNYKNLKAGDYVYFIGVMTGIRFSGIVLDISAEDRVYGGFYVKPDYEVHNIRGEKLVRVQVNDDGFAYNV